MSEYLQSELEDAEYNARESIYAEQDYLNSLGLCLFCQYNDMNEKCQYYKMPLQVIGGRKKKCKGFKIRSG